MPPIGHGGHGFELEAMIANATANQGFFQDYPVNPISQCRTSAGLVLTAGTTPIVSKVGNVWTISWAATDTSTLVVPWTVPGEFNDRVKELAVWATFGKTGTTDAVTITPTMYTRAQFAAESQITLQSTRVFTAASTYVDGTTTFDIPAATTTAPIVACMNFSLGTSGLVPGSPITLNLACGTHGTDGINLYAMWFRINRFANMAPVVNTGGSIDRSKRFAVRPFKI